MLCQFDKLLYPRVADASTVDYMIAIYRPLEIIRDTDGDMLSQIKAVGYCLPIAENLRYRLNGHWAKHPKHGLQFEVEGYEEVISHTKEGIIGYLSSGQIKGVGPRIALSVLSGMSTQDLADAVEQGNATLLTRVPGIGKKTADRLVLELKGKLAGNAFAPAGGAASAAQADILSALMALGYSEREAQASVRALPAEVTVSEGIRLALKALAR